MAINLNGYQIEWLSNGSSWGDFGFGLACLRASLQLSDGETGVGKRRCKLIIVLRITLFKLWIVFFYR